MNKAQAFRLLKDIEMILKTNDWEGLIDEQEFLVVLKNYVEVTEI